MLGVVTCFFNPCGYKRNLENYFRFRDALGYDLVTVELSFNGEYEIADAIHLQGGSENVMWQKERLLNIGINSLPAQYDKVAWIDTDLLFMNPKWYQQAEHLLETQQVVQLCERIHQTDSEGKIVSSRETFAKGYVENRLKEQWFHTGGAWAARRDALGEMGLFDQDIIGGADAFLAFSWSGDVQRAAMHAKNTFADKTRKFYQKQANIIHSQVQGEIGVVPGDAIHLWHGEPQNRLYIERLEFLKPYDFNPRTDIKIDKYGLWRWNSNKPEMHRDVANYFVLRCEDESEEEITQADSNKTASKKKQPAQTRNVTKWSVGVTTAPREKPTLERSLISLKEAGWENSRLFAEPGTPIPEQFQYLPISQRDNTLGAFPNWYLALSEMVMREPRAEAFFICQDDVLLSAGLRDYLEQKLWPSSDLGVVSVYCPSHYTNSKPKDSKAGFHIEQRGWNSWGALAYLFSNRSARSFLSSAHVLNHRGYGPVNGLRNIDSVVGAWCKKSGHPYYVHSPSLARHIGDTSTIWNHGRNHGRRQASDFQKQIQTN